jgi:hypothetical protein
VSIILKQDSCRGITPGALFWTTIHFAVGSYTTALVGAVGDNTGGTSGPGTGALAGATGVLVGATGALAGAIGLCVGSVGAPGAAAWISSAEILALSLIEVKTMVNNPPAPTLTVADRVKAAFLPTC